MSNGIKVTDSLGTVLLDSTTITYTLLGTLYCPAASTVSAQFPVSTLTASVQVFLTDTFSITTAPILATATLTTNNGVVTCRMSGGTVGCTAYVFGV